MFKKSINETGSRILLRNQAVIRIDELRDRSGNTPKLSENIFFQKQTGIDVYTPTIGDLFLDTDNKIERLNAETFYILYRKYIDYMLYNRDKGDTKLYENIKDNTLYSFYMFMIYAGGEYDYDDDHSKMFDDIFLTELIKNNCCKDVDLKSYCINMYALFLFINPFIDQHYSHVNVDFLFTLLLITKLFYLSEANKFDTTIGENIGNLILTYDNKDPEQKSLVFLIYNIEHSVAKEVLHNFHDYYEFKNGIALPANVSDLNIVIHIETKTAEVYKFTL
jgi:hypothetical protein